jgi:hypothetical protein
MRLSVRQAAAVVIPAALLALALTWAIGHQRVLAQFFNPQPDPPGFGIVGLMVSETMRTHAFCEDHTIAGVPPGPCSVLLEFRNGSNTVLKTTTLSLQPGHYGKLDLLGTDLKWNSGQVRQEIHPNVEFETGHVILTVQMFDTATGQTHAYVNAAVPRLSLMVQ